MKNETYFAQQTHELQVPRPSPDVIGHIDRLIGLVGVKGHKAANVTLAGIESAGLIYVSAGPCGVPLDNASEVFASDRPGEAAFVLSMRLANQYRTRVEVRKKSSGVLSYSLVVAAQKPTAHHFA